MLQRLSTPMTIILQLIQALSDSLSALGLPEQDIKLSPPNNPDFGDLSSNLALALAKDLQKNPIQIANDIKDTLKLPQGLIDEVTVTPPGFLNFKIGQNYYYETLAQILSDQNFGRGITGKGKKANVEFVSANPTGPLTVGHGRQAVLGDCVARILQWNSYDVTKEYYYNNAGRQMRILGQSVEARYFNTELPPDGYQGDYIIDIAKLIRSEEGDNIEHGDSIFQKKAEEIIFEDIKKSLEKLSIHHDVFSNEQTFYDNGSIDQTISDLKNKDLIYEADGATWLKTTTIGMDEDRVLIKSTGEPTYRLPDIAYHRNKLERDFNFIVDIFGADHMGTYPDILAALNSLDYDTGNIRVLIHQFVTLIKDGEKVKMSTRKADFITLEKLTKEIGADVVRYFFIMRGMNSHLNFDLDLAADQSEKNPVYYLQYAYARICNIIKHGESKGISYQSDYDAKLLNHSAEIRLLKKLDQFPIIIANSLQSLEPQSIANYLQDTANCFHKFYSECHVITDDIDLSNARIALVSAAQTVLANGLDVLGISSPEKM